MRELVDGVFELSLGFVNLHVVVTDDGVVLVDTGLPRRSARIQKELLGIRKSIGEVRSILLTHHHFDHTGNVADLRTRSGARVFAHAADAPVISGAARPEATGALVRMVSRVMSAQPTKIDQVITGDGSEPLPGFTAVHTPGHTRGHVSYLLDRAGGVLFAGDDLGDLEAFEAVRALRDGGLPALLVCSGSEEQEALAELADVVVDGPGGVLDLLDGFAAQAG